MASELLDIRRYRSSLAFMMLLRCFALVCVFHYTYASCQIDEDCFLNGVCKGGACICDPAWTSANCSILNTLPAPQQVAFHGKTETTTSWGGSILAVHGSDSEDKYVMFAAEMINNCTLGSWTTNSEVVAATASVPTGPFTERVQVSKPWAHNPEGIYVDGKYVVFTLGDGVSVHGPPKDCTKGQQYIHKERTRIISHRSEVTAKPELSGDNVTVHFVVHYSENHLGPFQAFNASIINFPKEYQFPGNWNPAPMLMPDGKTVRIMVHTDTSPWGGEVIVEGTSWQGPFSPITKDITDCTKCEEDPFMWMDKRGNHHVLYHRMFDPAGGSPIPSPGWCGGHAFSRDGITWSSISRAYNTSVQFADGTAVEMKRRERPKLLFAADGVTPTHMSNGVVGPHGTYTIVVPLQTE